MASYKLQFIGPQGQASDNVPFVAACASDVWKYVHSAAKAVAAPRGTTIRVTDSAGDMIILTSVAAALLTTQSVAVAAQASIS